jgi:large subunit ribosomal protein L9
MKVILKESVQNLGTVGDVVNVRDGYARNFLVPRGLAIQADPRNVNAIEHEKKALEKKRLRELAAVTELAKALTGTRLVFQRKAADKEHLFGSVTHIDIEAGLKEKGYNISRRQIIMDHPIKALGEFTVALRFPGGTKAEIQIMVEQEGAA